TPRTWISYLSLHDALPILAANVKIAIGTEQQRVRLAQPGRSGGDEDVPKRAGAAVIPEHLVRSVATDVQTAVRTEGEADRDIQRSEEHTSELQSQSNLVCR